MALKIRLRQQGRKNRTVYRLVLADVRAPRDGKYIELLGWYNPIEADETKKLCFKTDRIQHWLGLGAQLSENAESLLRRASPETVQALADKRHHHHAKAVTKRKEQKKA